MSDRTTSGADLLKRIRPQLAEKSTRICLRPDLIEEWESANEELEEMVAAGQKGARLGTKPEGQRELAELVAELEGKIEESSADFRFRALTKDAWRALCDDHPPRRGNELDQYVGYNRDAVLDRAVHDCLIDPVFDDESWQQFVEVCSAGEWDELRKTVNAVNKAVVDAPKSVLASRILTRHADASGSPAPGE